MESFGKAGRRSRFHSFQAQNRLERFGREPVPGELRWKSGHQVLDLGPSFVLGERYEEVRGAQVTLVFGDLVFEKEVITEQVPRQISRGSVVLVKIRAPMSSADANMDEAHGGDPGSCGGTRVRDAMIPGPRPARDRPEGARSFAHRLDRAAAGKRSLVPCLCRPMPVA